MKSEQIKKIAVSGMLIAVAFVLTMLTSMFKVAGFLSLDLKDVALSIIALLFGPVYGLISVAAVALLEFATISSTGWYGLVMNALSSGTFVLVCGLIYKYKRNFSGAIIATSITVVSVTAVMLLANIFITPQYLLLIGAAPNIEVAKTIVMGMLATVLLPFNLFKTIMNASIMLLIYKPFTSALKATGLIKNASDKKYVFNKKSFILTVVTIILLIAAVGVMLWLGIQIDVAK